MKIVIDGEAVVIPSGGGEPAMEAYSEDEAVIGTYLGKPLYRKKFTGTTPSTAAETLIAQAPSSMESLIKRYGGFVDTYGASVFIPCSFPSGTIDIYIKEGNLYMVSNAPAHQQNRPFFLWLEYTKTTD